MNGFEFDNGSISSVFQNLNFQSGESTYPITAQLPIDSDASPYTDSPDNACVDNNDSADAVLKFINEMLMEEDLEEENCMLQDRLALQAAEKSFYDVIGQRYPPSPRQILPCSNQKIYSSDDCFIMGSSNNCYTTASSSSLVESNYVLQSSLINSPFNTFLVPDLYSQIQPFERFQERIGEAGERLLNDDVNVSAQSNFLKPSKPELVAVTMAEKTIRYSPPDGLGVGKIISEMIACILKMQGARSIQHSLKQSQKKRCMMTYYSARLRITIQNCVVFMDHFTIDRVRSCSIVDREK